MKTKWVKRKAILDKDGNPLSVHPGNDSSPNGNFHAWRIRMREKYGDMLDRISVDGFIAEKRAEAEREEAMTTTTKKQFIYDKDGNPISIRPSDGPPMDAQELDAWLAEKRAKFGHLFSKISVDEIIADKRTEAARDL